jgi:hypothetical protein
MDHSEHILLRLFMPIPCHALACALDCRQHHSMSCVDNTTAILPQAAYCLLSINGLWKARETDPGFKEHKVSPCMTAFSCLNTPARPHCWRNDTVLRPAGKLADHTSAGSVRICCNEGSHTALDDLVGAR